jgi:hypothetical protein
MSKLSLQFQLEKILPSLRKNFLFIKIEMTKQLLSFTYHVFTQNTSYLIWLLHIWEIICNRKEAFSYDAFCINDGLTQFRLKRMDNSSFYFLQNIDKVKFVTKLKASCCLCFLTNKAIFRFSRFISCLIHSNILHFCISEVSSILISVFLFFVCLYFIVLFLSFCISNIIDVTWTI